MGTVSEYISRNEVDQKLHEAGGCDASDEWARGYDAGITEAIDIIDNIPVAEVAPAVHAHWKYNKKLWLPECSVCEARPFKGYIPSMDEVRRVYKFCPVCGAKMDESEDNDNA